MAQTKKPIQKKRTSKSRVSIIGVRSSRFNLKIAVIVGLMFGAVGVYLLIRSFAAPGIALTASNLDPTTSVNATIITEKVATSKRSTPVVQLVMGPTSKAVFISNDANLAPGQYKACAAGLASTGTVYGTMAISQYNGGPVGATTSHNYNLPLAADYSAFRCFPFTITTAMPGIQATFTDLSGGNIRISSVIIQSTGNIGAPTSTLTAVPLTVTQGSASTLTWDTTNTTSCTASGAWSGSQPTSGTATTGALDKKATFTLTCKGTNSGTTQTSVTVQVTALPPPISSSSSDFVGVDAYHSSDFPKIASLGITQVRMDFPAGTNYNNPDPSNFKAAKANGITILPILDYNYWTDTGGGGDGHNGVPVQYDQLWAQRQIAIIKSAMDSAGAGSPEALEVYNEPWNPGFWRNPDPAAYLQLVEATAKQAWSVWPNVKILVAADTINQTTDSGANWRAPLLADDTTGFLNDPRIHPTVHPYVSERTPTQQINPACNWQLDRYKCAYNDFKAHGSPNPTVWVTEFGWESNVVGSANQATYTTQALQIMQSSSIVDKAYVFEYNSGDSWDYNWLDTNNNCKQICSSVQSYIQNN